MTTLSHSYGSTIGLQRYMHAIYSYMTVALAVSGISAYLASKTPAFLNAVYVFQDEHLIGTRPLAWVILLAPLALIFLISFRIQTMSFTALRFCYWLYAILVGLSLTTILLTYTHASIAQVFFTAGGMFAVMSLYGHIAQRDLTGLGNLLFMALWGLILAMLLNLWFQSAGFQLWLSIIGVLVFVGLIAYDTQKLKRLYSEYAGDDALNGRLVVMGALTLYLDMLNLFLNLLALIGKRRK